MKEDTIQKNPRDFSAMGKKGSYRRALSLTPQRRSEIASQAAKKRWNDYKKLSTISA